MEANSYIKLNVTDEEKKRISDAIGIICIIKEAVSKNGGDISLYESLDEAFDVLASLEYED